MHIVGTDVLSSSSSTFIFHFVPGSRVGKVRIGEVELWWWAVVDGSSLERSYFWKTINKARPWAHFVFDSARAEVEGDGLFWRHVPVKMISLRSDQTCDPDHTGGETLTFGQESILFFLEVTYIIKDPRKKCPFGQESILLSHAWSGLDTSFHESYRWCWD